MTGSRRALLISEVGWRGLKEYSAALIKKGLSVDIVIKGKVDKEVLDIITKPAGLAIRAVPKTFFRLYMILYLLAHKVAGDLETIVITKKNTKGWIGRFGFETKLLVETKEGYRLE